MKKKKKTQGQTLTYPIVLRGEGQEKIARTLHRLQEITNHYLPKNYNPETLYELGLSDKKAYKLLESNVARRWKKKVPSRVNRGMLEITGRILRTIEDRKKLYELLVTTFGQNPVAWDYQKLIKEKGIYVKSQYIKNLAEQTENFFEVHGEYPKDFFALQSCPRLRKAMFTYAPDDGQAIQIEKREDHLCLHLKVMPEEESKWEWITLNISLPTFLRDLPAVAPDLRLVNIHGEWLPVLDYKVQVPWEKKQRSPYFLTVDWGVRKLITMCVFDRAGYQISPPIFLKFEPIQKKLLAIRNEIDHLKSKRDKLPMNHSLGNKYNREIAKRWRKFSALQKELAHLASSVIVLVAQIYQCSEIYVEWLKGLKSSKFSPSLNFLINTTVREAIYEKVAYKANLVGISLKRPVQPYGTSQYCPRCGAKGYHVKAPNSSEPVKSGSWFVCPSCHFNADRDYVACCNLARKVLYGNLNDCSKGIAYTTVPTSDLLFRQSSSCEQLRRNLHGWKEVVVLNPQKFFCGTLRL